jgi:sugar phosphate permease
MGGWSSAFGPVIKRLTANGMLVGIGLGGVLGFVALYAVEELSMSETLAGAQLTIIGGLGFFGRLGWGALADRASGWRGLAVVLSAVSVVGSVAAWLAPNVGPWLLIIASIVIGTSAMAWNSIGMLAIVREQSLERAGTASGIVLLGFLTGFTIGPWAFGALVDATGAYTSSWFMVTVAFVLSALVLVSRRGPQ